MIIEIIMETSEILGQIGAKIKAMREERKMTQQDLASLCDFETSNLSRIESGRSNVTIGTLHKIAKAFNVAIKVLL